MNRYWITQGILYSYALAVCSSISVRYCNETCIDCGWNTVRKVLYNKLESKEKCNLSQPYCLAQGVDSYKRRSDAENLTLLNNVETFIK